MSSATDAKRLWRMDDSAAACLRGVATGPAAHRRQTQFAMVAPALDPDAEAAMLEEDLTEPGMVMRIVSFDAKPFAYAQDYAVHRWPQAHFAGLPSGARQSILHRRAGNDRPRTWFGLFAPARGRLQAEGAPAVAIDLAADNMRARRGGRICGEPDRRDGGSDGGRDDIRKIDAPIDESLKTTEPGRWKWETRSRLDPREDLRAHRYPQTLMAPASQ